MITPNHPSIQHALAVTHTNYERLTAIETKTDHITVAQPVNLDDIEADTNTNNAKVTYPSADATKVGTIPAGLSGYEARIAALEAVRPKAFGKFTSVPSPALLGTSYNVASISRAGTGLYSVVIDTDMTTANYTVIVSCEESAATTKTVMTSSHATTGFNVAIRDVGHNLSDSAETVSFVVFEDNT